MEPDHVQPPIEGATGPCDDVMACSPDPDARDRQQGYPQEVFNAVLYINL